MAISEAEANPAFLERLAKALAADEKPVKAPVERKRQTKPAEHKRPSNRRTPAMLDPVQLGALWEFLQRCTLREHEVLGIEAVGADRAVAFEGAVDLVP